MERNKLYVAYLKAVTPCADCGSRDAGDLTFDHLPGYHKVDTISNMVYRKTLRVIKIEVAKCEIVCWSCHQQRENARGRSRHRVD